MHNSILKSLFVLTIVSVSNLTILAKVIKAINTDAVTIKSVASVGNELITDRDVEERLKLIVGASPVKLDESSKKLLRKLVLEALITEKLKVLYAKKFNMSADKEYVDERQVLDHFEAIARSNGLSGADFKKQLEKSGIDVKTFLDQIYAKLTWNAYVSARYGSQVSLSEKELDEKYALITKMLQNKAYNVERFWLPFSGDKERAEAKKTVKEIISLLKAGIDFQSMIRQFSAGNDSVVGGELGFISDNELPYKNENEALKKMSPGELRVVENNSGISILKLNSSICPKDILFDVVYVTLPLSKEPTQAEVEGKIKQINDIAIKAKSAADMVEKAKAAKLQVAPMMSFDAAHIDPQLKELFETALKQNGISKIVYSRTEVVCACVINKRHPTIRMPNKGAIKEKMLDDKLESLARLELERARKTVHVERKGRI